MRILITGATGFVGGQVLEQLRSTDHYVTLLVRKSSNVPDDLLKWVQVLRLDDLTVPFEAETDVLIHMAGPSKWGSLESQETVFSALAILDNLLCSVHFSRFIYVSSAAARLYDGDELPDNVYFYALAKKMCERKVSCLPSYAILRPGEVYGIDPTMITAGNIVTLRDSPFATTGRVSVCDVEVVSSCIVSAALSSENGTFDLGGENVSISDIGKCARKCAGKIPISIPVPSVIVGFAARHFAKLLKLEPEAAKYGVYDWSQDSSAAVRAFGYSIVSYRKTIAKVCTWLQEAGK